MFDVTDDKGERITAAIRSFGDGDQVVEVAVTSLIGITNNAWLTSGQAYELAAALVHRAIEIDVTASLARASQPSAQLGLTETPSVTDPHAAASIDQLVAGLRDATAAQPGQ